MFNSLGVPGTSGPEPGSRTSRLTGRSETGRKKVLLKPGRGLVDWIKLSNVGRMSPYPLVQSVDHTELSRHNTESDCWILLFDTVYDVTRYLDFHPGGVPQLMRAAGTDATELFNHYHRWVNYRSMLKSCVIGPFMGQREKLLPPREEQEEEQQQTAAAACEQTADDEPMEMDAEGRPYGTEV